MSESSKGSSPARVFWVFCLVCKYPVIVKGYSFYKPLFLQNSLNKTGLRPHPVLTGLVIMSPWPSIASGWKARGPGEGDLNKMRIVGKECWRKQAGQRKQVPTSKHPEQLALRKNSQQTKIGRRIYW